MTQASYVYAIIRPLPAGALNELPTHGIEDAEVRVVGTGQVAALVSSVDAADFDPKGLRDNMIDLPWLERTARAHDQVINAAARVTTAIPLRLGTTCVDDSAVADLLVDLAPAARRAFDRLDGRREWGVQIFDRSESRVGDAVPTQSGSAFLLRKRAELQQREVERTLRAAEVDAAFEALSAVASAACRHPVQAARLRHDPRPMLLNAAFLVDTDATDLFLDAVNDQTTILGEDRVVATGPWAAYSFAELAP